MKKMTLLVLIPMLFAIGCGGGSSEKYFTITFTDEDGNVLDTVSTKENTLPVYTKEEPTKSQTKKYTYTFSGWAPELIKATEDATYVATFEGTLRSYTIEFLDYDYSTLSREVVEYGTKPKEPENVTKEYEDDYYSYVFSSWNSKIKTVTGDVTYYPLYTSSKK